MNLQELIIYYTAQQQNVDGQGIASIAREVTPLTDLLSKYFLIKNFGTAKEIADNIIMAEKDPSFKTGLVTQKYLQLPQELNNPQLAEYIQMVLWEWLKYSFIQDGTLNVNTCKNAIMYSLVDTSTPNEKKTLKTSNLTTLSASDVTKQLSGSVGYEFVELFSSEFKNEHNNLIALIGAIGYLCLNGTYPRELCANFISILFKTLVSTDGFIESSRILKILTDISSKDLVNMNEKNKYSKTINNGGIDYNFQEEGIKLNALPLSSMADNDSFIKTLLSVITNELAASRNTPAYQNIISFVTLALYNLIPSNIIEDMKYIFNNQPPKYNITELNGIHLNALILKNTINSVCFGNGFPYLSAILSYSIVVSVFKGNPLSLTQSVNITGEINKILTTLGLNPINTQNVICMGKVDIKEAIRLDINLKTSGFYIDTYSMITNDISLRDPLIKQFLMNIDRISPQAIYNSLCQTYSTVPAKYKMVNLDFFDTYLNSVQLSQFTSSVNENMRNFLNSYVSYLAEEIKLIEGQR